MRHIDSFYICKHLLLCVYGSIFTVLSLPSTPVVLRKKIYIHFLHDYLETTLLLKRQSFSGKIFLMEIIQIYLAVKRLSQK